MSVRYDVYGHGVAKLSSGPQRFKAFNRNRPLAPGSHAGKAASLFRSPCKPTRASLLAAPSAVARDGSNRMIVTGPALAVLESTIEGNAYLPRGWRIWRKRGEASLGSERDSTAWRDRSIEMIPHRSIQSEPGGLTINAVNRTDPLRR
jgi:hypothetical protein